MAASGMKLKTLPSVTVVTAGVSTPVYTSSLLVYGATIQSQAGNTGTQYMGDSTVSSSNGIECNASNVIEIDAPSGIRGDQFDISTIFVDSSTSGAIFRVVCWIRG